MKYNFFYKIAFGIIVISIILLFIAIGIFMFNFSNYIISDDIESWAYFGDYFGGILNPILTLINISVFIILTLAIQNITNKNNIDNLETSKKIALMSMKHEELRHFKEEMDNNLKEWGKNLESIENIKTVLYRYNVLEYRMLFLFPELKNSNHNIELREYLVGALSYCEEGKLKNAAYNYIPVSNIYGMLVSDMGEWTVN